jgi:flagellar basal body-associated protein FliL
VTLAFEFQATLLGVAAVVAAVGGVISTIWAIRKGRREEQEDCYRLLRESRAETEQLARELHELKMERIHESE